LTSLRKGEARPMADKELDSASKRDFVKALAATMHAEGARHKRGYLVAGAAVVVIAAAVAVAVGAASAPGSAKASLSAANSTASSPAAPTHAVAAPASTEAATSGAARPAAAKGGSGPVVTLPASGGSGRQPGTGTTTVTTGGSSPSSGSSGSTSSQPGTGQQPTMAPAPTPAPTTATPTTFFVTGQVTCESGQSVEGVWVSAAAGSAYASWQALGNGSTSDWWFTLPQEESYSLHVGCGGSPPSWAVATYTATVSGPHNSFNCQDSPGASGYGQCETRA
jgi:hypothetical protein